MSHQILNRLMNASPPTPIATPHTHTHTHTHTAATARSASEEYLPVPALCCLTFILDDGGS